MSEQNDQNAAQAMRTQSPEDQEPPVTQPPRPVVEDGQKSGADDEETDEMSGPSDPQATTKQSQPLGAGLTDNK
jgi:hypothetical protein